MTGRPSKIHDTKALATMLSLLRSCVPLSVACRKVGIGMSTIRDWRERARDEPEGPHAAFVADLDVAIAEAEIEMVRAIYDAASSDPRQAAWLLERRFGGRWSPKTKTENKHKVEVTGKPVWLPDNGRDG
jgi:hypothetical protein